MVLAGCYLCIREKIYPVASVEALLSLCPPWRESEFGAGYLLALVIPHYSHEPLDQQSWLEYFAQK